MERKQVNPSSEVSISRHSFINLYSITVPQEGYESTALNLSVTEFRIE